MIPTNLLQQARQTIKSCAACDTCDGRACRGKPPGPGGAGGGVNFMRSYDKVRDVLLNVDFIAPNVAPDTSFEAFGRSFKYPFFAAPIGLPQNVYGIKYDDTTYAEALLSGCEEAGILGFTGAGTMLGAYEAPVQVIKQLHGAGIPTAKSWPDATLERCFEMAEDANAPAVAVDIDCVGLIQGGGPFVRRSEDELRRLILRTTLPVILKGIMTKRAAFAAADCGAAGIVVSTHGGRLSPSLPAPFEVLEEIALAVKERILVFVDGGIRSGEDVFKALALGAHAALIGRPFAVALYGGGAEGARDYACAVGENLRQAMLLTGAESLAGIKRDMVRGG